MIGISVDLKRAAAAAMVLLQYFGATWPSKDFLVEFLLLKKRFEFFPLWMEK